MRAFIVLAILLTGCADHATVSEQSVQERPAIRPHQFALVPCPADRADERPACQLLAAGGKYYLMGAPRTAIDHLRDEEIRLLDGVLLFSLLPDQIEGLDTIRNTTWRRGRALPLLVAGPEGTAIVTEALDAAYEIADAEVFTRESPPGGYDASLMHPLEVLNGRAAGTQVVNTGDLIIRGFYAPSGQVVYHALYNEQEIGIGMCGGSEDSSFLWELSSTAQVSVCNDRDTIAYFIE